MFFKKYKKRRNCVHKYNVVDISYEGISGTNATVTKRYVLLCSKCEKRVSVRSYDYDLMNAEGLIESREQYNIRTRNHVKTKIDKVSLK